MAGDSVVGALRVVLGADTAQFEDGLKKANKSLDQFGNGMKVGLAAVATAAAAAATALGVAIKGAINEADKLGKMAQKIGVPVEELSALAHGANLAGVSLDSLGTGLGRLSKNMLEAAESTRGPAAEAFNSLGISVKNADGSLKSSSEVMTEIAGKFAGMEDGAGKTATAIKLFGRAGADLIPLLNAGSTGIAQMVAEAQKLGIVIDTQTAKAAEQFNDNLTRLGKAADGLVLKMIGSGGLAQALADVTDALVEWTVDSNAAERSAALMAGTLKVAVGWVMALTTALDALTLPFRAIVAAMFNIAQGNFAGAWAAIRDRVVDTKNSVAELKAALTNIFDPDESAQLVTMLGGTLKLLDQLQVKGRFKVGPTKEDMAGFEATAQRIADLYNKLWEETRTPQEQIAAKQAEINALFLDGARHGELYARVIEQAAQRVRESVLSSSADIAGSISGVISTFAGKNRELGIAGKAFAVSQAIINTYLAATKALATTPLPWPAPQIAAAAAIAAGLASVAKIVAQPGYAAGGSFTVPGGISGVDTRMVPLNLAAGERVDITPANEARTTRVVEVQLPGIRPGDFFRGDVLREMFDSLNKGIADGYRLKIA